MNSLRVARFGFQSRFAWSAQRILAGLLASCALLSGCASERHDLELAERAVDVFHARLNSAEYTLIYQETGDKIKEATSGQNFVKLLQRVHQTLGAVRNSVPRGTVFQLAQGTIRLDYDTTFVRGTGREQFVWQIKGNQAILHSYRIDSTELAGK